MSPFIRRSLSLGMSIVAATVILSLVPRASTAAPAAQYDGPFAAELPATDVVRWMHALYDRIEAEAISAPAASRLYGYAGITVYEAAVPGMPDNRSLSGQLNELGDLPLPESGLEYDWIAVINYAMRDVLSALFYDRSSESLDAFEALYQEIRAERLALYPESEDGASVVADSETYAEALAKELIEWINDDHYREVRARDPITVGLAADYDHTASYVLTGETTQPAEPYWGDLRPLALEYVAMCDFPLNVEFSTEADSTFYLQALEVFDVGNDLTPEQRAIAEWWVDTPGLSGTPAGHWVQIENQLVEDYELPLSTAVEMYGMVGMALADAFIATWRLKYEVMLLRPETYINDNISTRWRPYIETPPFPEYPSGHSTVSGAAADMLVFFFGERAFTDRTHEDEGLRPRSFTSFTAAATEAAMSRLYGGIHFRTAIENGVRMGQCITQSLLDGIVMNVFTQGE
jgi:hypothetical protein